MIVLVLEGAGAMDDQIEIQAAQLGGEVDGIVVESQPLKGGVGLLFIEAAGEEFCLEAVVPGNDEVNPRLGSEHFGDTATEGAVTTEYQHSLAQHIIW